MRLERPPDTRARLCKICSLYGKDQERHFDWYRNTDTDTPVGRNGMRWVMVDRTTGQIHGHHRNGDLKPGVDAGPFIVTTPAPSETPTDETPTDRPDVKPDVAALADAVVTALRPRLGDLLDPDALHRRIHEQGESILREVSDRLEQSITDKLDALRMPVRVETVDPIAKKTQDIGIQHSAFPTLLRRMATRRVNVLMVGPAGSGKTEAGTRASKALGLRFYPKSLGPSSREHEFAGFHGPNAMVHGILREPFENGGVLLLDEMDRANAAVLTILNAALANSYFSFPDAVVERHPDFICIAAANTWGNGADRQYAGATKLDASTLNRFVFMPWDYDEMLERAIAQGYADQAKDPSVKARIHAWVKRVQAIRKAAFGLKAQIVVSPRATIYGSVLLLAGETLAEVEQATIWGPVDPDTSAKVIRNVQ